MSATNVKTEVSPSLPDDWVRHEMVLPDRGGSMSYLMSGGAGFSAPLIIFAHASGFHGQTYARVLAQLTDSCRVILPDLRGHGESTLPANANKLKNWTPYLEDMLAFLDALGERRYILAGHSLGAGVSFMAGQRRSDQTMGLLLAEPVLVSRTIGRLLSWGRSVGLTRRLVPIVRRAEQRRTRFVSRQEAYQNYRGRGAFRTWPDAMLQDYVAGAFRDRTDGHVELACARDWEVATYQVQDNDLWGSAHRAQFPIHLLRGEHGSTVFPPMVKRLQSILPQSRVETVSGTSHFLPMERPDVIVRALEAMSQSFQSA